MKVEIQEKYERTGWPAQDRPDLKPPAGWSLPLLVGVNRIYNHSLSPDGQWIAFLWDREGQTDVYLMPSAGGWPARLTFDRPAYQYWWEEVPRWSPDSRQIAFGIDKQIHVYTLGSGLTRRASPFAAAASSPVWLPGSRGLVVSIEEDETSHLLVSDPAGSWPRLLSDQPGDDGDARPSPDGQTLLYHHRPFADLNRWELRLVPLSGGPSRLLIGQPGLKCWSGRWSPDGRSIAFLSQQSGHNEIWLADPAGGEPRQLTATGCDLSDLAWSPDGSSLAAVINRGGAFDLVLVAASDGALRDLRRGKGVYARPCFLPDGRSLTVEYSSPTQPPDLYRVEFDRFAPAEVLPDSAVQQLTFSIPPALACLPLVTPEAVSYPSFDGLQIPALLYRPAQPNGAVIVHPHGGPRDQYSYDWDLFTQYLVAKGYTYLAINYRGGTGYGTAYEMLNQEAWGIGDTQDCLYAARYAAGLPWADRGRIAIMGGSYGGYMTINSLSNDPDTLFACGVCIYGDAELHTSWALCDRSTRLYTEMQLGHPSRAREVYRAGSPVYQVDNVHRPVLVLHGLEDPVVPPQASELWVEALRRAGKTFEYKTYAGESHGFLKHDNLLDIYRRIERFLDWYLI